MKKPEQGRAGHVGAGVVAIRLWPYIRRRGWLVIASTVAIFTEVGLRLFEPWLLKFIFDSPGHAAGETTTGIGILDSLSAERMLMFSAIGLVILVAFRAAASYLRRVGFALAGNIALTEIRSDLFVHLQRLSLSFHSKKRSGDLATRLTSDIGRLQEVVSTAVLPLMAHALTVIGVIVVMLVVEWRLALVAVAVLPLFWLSTMNIGKQIRSTARKERERHGEMGAIATEAIGSIRVVQSLGGENTHEKRFSGKNLSSLKEGVRGKRLSARLLGTADVFIALGTGIVLWYGASLVMRGELELTTLLVFYFYHKNMTRPIRNMAKYSGRTAKALASAERVVEILDTAPTIKEARDAIEAPHRVDRLAIHDLSFAYEPGTKAVEHVTLEAESGSVTALVGPSGAGKSTLMSLLLRLYDPDGGSITADGVDLHQFKVGSWRRSIAIVPQETTLFAATVSENIAFGQSDVTDDRIRAAAEIACADRFIRQLPDGYDTIIGERGSTLSEGQKQRLAIARAACREAPILVLDEPTASLDNENSELIAKAIRNLSRDRICFVISHDLRAVEHADRIVCLEHGRVVESGSHEELIANRGVYERLYQMESGRPEGQVALDA